MNRKGGVGKTSITANVAGVLAGAGYRVLAIDLDAQGNLGDDLGYRATDLNDEGAALFEAVAMGKALVPTKGIRENLDVIPAGERTSVLADHLMVQSLRRPDQNENLALRLSEIADNYDLILLDCPPGDAALQTQALIAARWILTPTQPDAGSLKGLEQLTDRVVATLPANPTLSFMGVVLFPMLTSAKRVQADVRATLETMMGKIAPTFTSTIRFAQAAGVDARSRGQLVIELARDAEGQDRFAWTKALRKQGDDGDEPGAPTRRLADSVGSLASDYLKLTEEILLTLAEQERRSTEATGAPA